MAIYAKQLRGALAAAFDPAALAAAWIALHPKGTGSVSRPALAQFLSRAREAITAALRRVLDRLWPEAWVLGEKSAEALVAGVEDVDWGAWKPGDYEAAEQVAGPGLRQLLAETGVRIKSITDSRLEELSDVLERTLASDETTREMNGPKPLTLSVQSLTEQLKDVLDNPVNAELVAWTEISRAQSAAAEREYAESGVIEVDLSTAHDDRVCPICDAVADENPHPLGSVHLPLHPRERCALVPAALPALAGVS
jgi:hypothetical protein